MKIFILLYADDTVIFSNTQQDLQKALQVFENYCDKWRLTVNVSKTKILIISRGRPNKHFKFFFNKTELEIVNEYKYLGIYISRSGSFNTTKKYIAEQANKALFSLFRKIRSLNLTFDLQIDLFNKTIKPILLYGCEIWGYGNLDVIERIQLKFLKYSFNLKKTTPTFMIYGELGIMPVALDIKTRVISYWSKLLSMHEKPTRLSYVMYHILYNLHKNKILKSQYIENVKCLLESSGFSGIWQSQNAINPRWLSLAISQNLKDQYLQNWSSVVEKASSGTNYRLFNDNLTCSKYVILLPERLCKMFIRFRTRNHKLPVERGRWNGIPLQDRKCPLCFKDLGDEYHYILVCEHFKEHRIKYIKRYYYRNPNTQKFKQLMNSENSTELKKLCYFIQAINSAL